MTSVSSYLVEIMPEQLSLYCCGDDKIVMADFTELKSRMENAKSPFIKSGDTALAVDTINSFIYIKAWFVDANNHKHTFTVRYSPSNAASNNAAGLIPHVECRYLWEGKVDTEKLAFNSFAEYLMLELWRIKIDVELTDCSRGLKVLVPIENAVDTLWSMIQITSVSLRPKDWFTSDFTGWIFYPVYRFLTEDLIIQLQNEAREDRWKNITPANFIISRAEDHALLCVEYGEENLYRISFNIGMRDGSFLLPSIYKHLEIEFDMENLSTNPEIHSYMDEVMTDFMKFVRAYMDIAFNYHALFVTSETGFSVMVERKWALDKFCLLLDLFHGLVDGYRAERPLITSEIDAVVSRLRETMSADFEIVKDDDTLKVFANGNYKSVDEDPEDVWDGLDCPF